MKISLSLRSCEIPTQNKNVIFHEHGILLYFQGYPTNTGEFFIVPHYNSWQTSKRFFPTYRHMEEDILQELEFGVLIRNEYVFCVLFSE